MTPIARVLLAVADRGVRRSGSGWTCRCPAHEDARASLSLAEGDDGRALLHCHVGCETEAIAAALKISVAELFPEPLPAIKTNGQNKKIVAAYDYRDEGRALLRQVVRYSPKGFSQRRPDRKGGWTYKLDGVRNVPYRLPELMAERLDVTAYVAEGEKDCDALARVGLLATTNAAASAEASNGTTPDFGNRCVGAVS